MDIAKSLPCIPETVTTKRCLITSALECTSWDILDGGKGNGGQVWRVSGLFYK